ncbi:MAG: ABC transporter substrate-binding protein [Inquilinaceae bacterium]
MTTMKMGRIELGRGLVAAGAILVAGLLSPMDRAAAETLVIAAPGTPEGFDGDALRPQTQNVVTQVYEPLVRYGRVTDEDGREKLDSGVIEGHLAESWEVSEDGKRWVLTLRQGVMSPYGNELTADDVVWSWNKSFDQKRTGNFIANVANVDSVEEVSKYEVAFNLSAPSSIFLRALTLYVPGIYDTDELLQHATEADPWGLEWLQENTAGFGAYHLDDLRPGEQAVFVANPNYFGEQPYFDRVIYRAVPSPASRVTLLKAGQVQWIDRPSVQQVIDLRADSNVKVEEAVGVALASVRMNPTFEPFDDVRVRRALNYAVDQKVIQDAVFQGTGTIALSIVPPAIEGYDPSFFDYGYDPDRARALLTEAGFPDGFETELLYSDIDWWQQPMAIQIADQLRDVGVEATPTLITASDMRSRSAPAVQDMPFFAFQNPPIVLDPVYNMFLLAHSQGVSNRAKYSNPEVDRLIDEARQSMDPEARVEMMAEAQRIWLEDSPWIMTVYASAFEAMAPNIVGWVDHPDTHERWYDLAVAD